MSVWELADLSTPWCIYVVVTLRVAEHIAAGHTNVAEIARLSDADPESLHRVLRHLVSTDVFTEPTPGCFELNDAARELLEPGVQIGLNLDAMGGRMAHSWSTLLSAVRTGKPAYDKVFGKPFWDDLQAHPDIRQQFDQLMGPGHGVPDWRILPDPADWESIRSVADVGGGAGYLLAEILRAQPHVRGTLIDLPEGVAGSAEVFREAGVEDRVSVVAQSFFDPLPHGSDVYILRKVLSDWPDDEAISILRRCADAARPSGRVIVFAEAQPNAEPEPELLMMVLVGGKARTLEELYLLASEAGLKPYALGRQESGKALVDLRPV